MPLSQEHNAELFALADRYQAPACMLATLPEAGFDPLTKNDRIGEVCMVVRRPSGRLLTAIKTYYPNNAYRLLTGGISPDEPIEMALLREVQEETGLDVAVRRFLAAVAYLPSAAEPAAHPRLAQTDLAGLAQRPAAFYTFAFLLDETGGILAPQDESERLGGFREVLPDELPAMATRLEQVSDKYDHEIAGSWRHWGIFRAIIHHVVYAALTTPTGNDPQELSDH